jgi:osmoprotectant transport system substrate-binding protein
MRNFLAPVLCALALVVGACAPASAPQPTATAKPVAAQSPAPAASPVSSPAAATSPAAKGDAPAAPTAAAQPTEAKPAGVSKPTVRVGSTNFSEQVILAELYAQLLEANGYQVERRLNLGTREIVFPALERGDIDMYPEYLATLLAFVTRGETKEADPTTARQQLQEALSPKGIAVLDFAPAVDTNAFVVTTETAAKHNLSKMSDLAPVAEQLVLGGPPECPQRPFCIPGLERVYGITFREFKPLDAGGPLTVAALEGNQIDVALLFSTDAVITQKGFVLLEDDKKLQAADNVAPVVREELLNQAPIDFATLLNGVSSKLTTEELTELNKQVGVDRQEPRDVAAAWLKAKGLVT